MSGIILPTATKVLLPLLLLFSLFLLLRGHDEPGGGFAGGLVASAAFALLATASGVPNARRVLHVDTRTLIGVGLALALASGLVGLVGGSGFLASVWLDLALPDGTPFYAGTTLLFDLGVYLVVVGSVLTIVFALEEE
ncbi:MAG: Na+/H+ antiporter subunit B [Chloroflexota bacterium]